MFHFITLSVLFLVVQALPSPKEGVCSGPHVELLVSPVIEDNYNRRITFDWENLPSGAEIGIFESSPSQGSNPVFQYKPSTANGWDNTTIEENHVLAQDLGFQAQCLSLYIAYRTDAEWKGISCLRTEPTWMEDLGSAISATKLRDLYIPGTHDSSAFKEYDFAHPDDLIKKYSVTQDEPVLGQLIYGARYIDLRVGYYPNNDEVWWGNHGIIQFYPMAQILANLTLFLQNTKEIVILDVQEFPVGFGDDKEVHRLFIQYLTDTFGDYIVSSKSLNWDSTVQEVLDSGRRLIIGYDDGEMVAEYEILWPAVRQMWGDKQHLEDLMDYLSGVVSKENTPRDTTKLECNLMDLKKLIKHELIFSPPQDAWSAMAQLTPSALDIALNTLKGLRHAAEAVNHDVTSAFRTAEWARNTNVLAIDFLRGSGAVRAAIQWNSGAGPCP